MPEVTQELDALVIGAGFSGMHTLKSLRDNSGMKVRVYQAGSTVGGAWYWNRYPGARCDSDAYVYCFTWDKQLLREWEWSERCPERSAHPLRPGCESAADNPWVRGSLLTSLATVAPAFRE